MSKILSIETSCDETSVAILQWSGERKYSVLSHMTNSQIAIHQEYGGVFPALAKREHQKNIIPILFQSLQESNLLVARTKSAPIEQTVRKKLEKILGREPEILDKIILLSEQYKIPKVKAIAVTYGPGLEIALWTGFNTARALSVVWGCNLVPTNHMEGHLYASMVTTKPQPDEFNLQKIQYPALGLLISGGHTELVFMNDEHKYKIIGQTLDDAVGEAYDKSARLLGIPYPGGIVVSQMAELARAHNVTSTVELPRPMIHTKDYNFSFSGLKTSVRNVVQKQTRMSKKFKQSLCLEFENAVSDVLVHKTKKAIDQYNIQSLVVGGGVSANTNIRRNLAKLCKEQGVKLYTPQLDLAGDNALMINLAGYRRWRSDNYPKRVSKVKGNLKIS